jgi:GTP-binding protein
VRIGDYDFVLADIPGLIQGAHEGVGIGDRFLGHIERCRVILHLVDVNEADVAEAYRTVRRELRAYGAGLDSKREIVALSKCDTVSAEQAAEQAEKLKKACRKKPFLISAVAGINLGAVLLRIGRIVKDRPGPDAEKTEAVEENPAEWSPLD